MRGGIWVLNIFALAWAAAAVLTTHRPTWWLIAPLLVTVAILVWASRQPVPAQADGARIGRLIGMWSAVEGAAIFVAINGLLMLGRADAIMPVIAILVGLHFLPLARGIPVRFYYATGAALVAVGVAGLGTPATVSTPIALAGAAAVILWLSAIGLTLRARRAASQGVSAVLA